MRPNSIRVGDAALVAERLARHGRVVAQLAGDHLAEEFMGRQVALEQVAMRQFLHLAHRMGDDDRS